GEMTVSTTEISNKKAFFYRFSASSAVPEITFPRILEGQSTLYGLAKINDSLLTVDGTRLYQVNSHGEVTIWEDPFWPRRLQAVAASTDRVYLLAFGKIPLIICIDSVSGDEAWRVVILRSKCTSNLRMKVHHF